MGRSRIADVELQVRNGYLMLTASLVLLVVSTWWVWIGFAHTFALARIGLGVLGIIASLILVSGLVILQPNESVVCLLFGRYIGTQHRPGYCWVNSFSTNRDNSSFVTPAFCCSPSTVRNRDQSSRSNFRFGAGGELANTEGNF